VRCRARRLLFHAVATHEGSAVVEQPDEILDATRSTGAFDAGRANAVRTDAQVSNIGAVRENAAAVCLRGRRPLAFFQSKRGRQ